MIGTVEKEFEMVKKGKAARLSAVEIPQKIPRKIDVKTLNMFEWNKCRECGFLGEDGEDGREEGAGKKKTVFVNNVGKKEKCRMQFHMTDAKRMLASVSKMLESGNDVHFSDKGSYVENTETGKKVALKKEGNVFIMEVWFLVDGKRKRGKIVVDSGAAENVMPKSWLAEVTTLKKQEGVRFIAANGQEIGNYGRKKIDFEPIGDEEEQPFRGQA